MALIKVGTAYINTQTVKMISAVEKGTEEDKKFGINVITNFGNYCTYCEGRTERNEALKRILELMNSQDENLIEIRKQLVAINSKISTLDKKLRAISAKTEGTK